MSYVERCGGGLRLYVLGAGLGMLSMVGCHRPPPELLEARAQPTTGEVWLTAAQVQAASIEVGPAVFAPLRVPVVCAGRVGFDDEKVAHVSAPVSGRIKEIFAPLGSAVAANGPLCSIQSLDVTQSTATLREAEADLTAARRAYQRQKSLYEGHAAAQKDYEASHTRYVQAEVERLRAAQRAALLGGGQRGSADTYTVRSPVAGTVVASAAHPGALVQGQYNAGASVPELFVVGALDTVWAQADVFEMDIHQVDVGDAVEVTSVADPSLVFRGTVDWVADTIDPKTRAARVRCRLTNPDHRLKPEMFVRMTILAESAPRVLIPRSALFRDGANTVVFVRQTQPGPKGTIRFLKRAVEAAEDGSGDMVPVLAGLSVDERVVTSGGVILLGG